MSKIVDAAKEELKGLAEEIKHVESVLKELKQVEKKLNKVIADFSEPQGEAPAVGNSPTVNAQFFGGGESPRYIWRRLEGGERDESNHQAGQ